MRMLKMFPFFYLLILKKIWNETPSHWDLLEKLRMSGTLFLSNITFEYIVLLYTHTHKYTPAKILNPLLPEDDIKR